MKTLSELDWNFDNVPDDELVACCYWEYARESAFIRDTLREYRDWFLAGGKWDENTGKLGARLEKIQCSSEQAGVFVRGCALGNQFTVLVPAYTMVNLLIPPAPINTPPVLASIGNQTVNVGQTVAFTASVTDTDQPPQTLTFNLLTGPGNAALNTNSGAFSWRPLVTQAGITNAFTLKVADNGSPSLSATQSFTVTVNPLAQPGLSSIGLSNGLIGFQVSGDIGPDYAVQGSTNLADWITLFVTNSPAMPFLWTDTNTATLPAQFYRIKAGSPLP
jgi:hypothetical protein